MVVFRAELPGCGSRVRSALLHSSSPISKPVLWALARSSKASASYRKADGTRLKVDDPELDPIWETSGRLNVPVFMHVAEPQEFFQPIDYKNERWLELALFGDRRYPPDQFPRFDE